MVDGNIVNVAKQYLERVAQAGIAVEAGVLFGSCARGDQSAESDIDLLVVSPDFDKTHSRSQINLLWGLRRFVDSRIEPYAVGSCQFREEADSPIIATARKEGVVVPFQPA